MNGAAVLQADFEFRETPTRTIGVALVLSILLHAVVIGLLPGMRPAKIDQPLLLTIDLSPAPEPEVAVQVPTPVPPQAVPPPPKPEPVPQPKRVEPIAVPPILATPTPAPERRIEVAPAPPQEIQPPPKPEVPPTARVEPEPPPQVVAAPPIKSEPTVQTQAPLAKVEATVQPQSAPVKSAPAVPEIDRAALGRSYGQQLHAAVEKNKRPYPRMAQMRRWEGVAEIRVQIGADGKVAEISILHSSGFDMLDQQALEMVKAAAALVEVPPQLRGTTTPVVVPVRFRLQNS
jgi:periplasmic protein TonB